MRTYNPMIQVSTEEGAECWASYLINGDASGIDEDEVKRADVWLERLDDDGYELVGVADGDASFDGYENVVEYQLLRHGPFAPPAGRLYEVVDHFDVWGHSSAECHEHNCPCMVETGNNAGEEREHDDNACECHYEVNESRRCGELFIGDDEDVVEAMVEAGHLQAAVLDKANHEYARLWAVEVEEPGDYLDINSASDGRPLYTLTPIDD